MACLADGTDEHLGLLRIADDEAFDLIQLQNGLSRLLVFILKNMANHTPSGSSRGPFTEQVLGHAGVSLLQG